MNSFENIVVLKRDGDVFEWSQEDGLISQEKHNNAKKIKYIGEE
ncbi:MAG: hypothetical protein ABEK17_01950 [Candidatus Aenigmatarchaeota archaeon]